jgi:hypothetical protein
VAEARIRKPLLIGLLGLLGLLLLVAATVVPRRQSAAPTLLPAPLHPAVPEVGDPAPDFVLQDTAGQEYHLRDRVGRSVIVLQFGSFS